jgi:hypothetical protein
MAFLTTPMWDYPCDKDYVKAGLWGQAKCVPKMPTNYGLTSKPDNSDKNLLDQYWLKPNKKADIQDAATDKNCPVGTFGYNGKCFQSCPKGFTLFAEQRDKQQLLTCMSTCERGWHDLTWVNEENGGVTLPEDGMYQHISAANQWCWHPLPDNIMSGDPKSDANVEKAIDTPYNLYIQTILYKDTAPEEIAAQQEKRRKAGQDKTPLKAGRVEFRPDSYLLEKRGVYAAKQIFEIGEAELPKECVFPNQISETDGVCYKPCSPSSWEKIGDTCYNVELKCPPRISSQDARDKTRCNPIHLDVLYGPSFVELMFYIAITALFLAIVIKIVKQAVLGI